MQQRARQAYQCLYTRTIQIGASDVFLGGVIGVVDPVHFACRQVDDNSPGRVVFSCTVQSFEIDERFRLGTTESPTLNRIGPRISQIREPRVVVV